MFNRVGGRRSDSEFRTCAAAADDPADFAALRDRCLRRRTLFEDPDFGAADSSLHFCGKPAERVEWKRPKEIVSNPKFFIDGASRFDVKQGKLGDCWLLVAIANLTLNDKLFNRVVPNDQEFDSKYAGIFHFKFWQFGKWVEVVVDDRLPTVNGKLEYLHSANENEFWSALLEKAYAKLYGSYEALNGGFISEATIDFTGGISEIVYLEDSKTNSKINKRLFINMLHAYQRQSLMGAAIMRQSFNQKKSNGLINKHAYSITKMCVIMDTKSISNNDSKIALIRVRNPWGNEHEWKGPWSDKSSEWSMLSKSDKLKCGLTIDYDGEFWISFNDFIQNFTLLDMCHLSPDLLSMEQSGNGYQHKWVTSMFEGKWVRGATAGGSSKYKETFASNPQYRITLEHPDVMDSQQRCTVIIELMQKNRRRPEKNVKLSLLKIGFTVYRLINPYSLPKPLDQTFFEKMSPLSPNENFQNQRQISNRFRLAPGTYCIVPSTYKPNEEAEFLLRVFSENENNLKEHDNNCEIVKIPDKAIQLQSKPRKIDKSIEKINNMFLKKGGANECIDWIDLKQILNYAFENKMVHAKFSKDVCRSIIVMADLDRSGKLGFEEFQTLWADINLWKTVFDNYGKKKKGYITGYELRNAMNSVGYNLNTYTLNMLGHLYANKKGYISFDDFIMCAIRLKTMTDIFRKQDRNNVKIASFTAEEWLEKTLCL